MVAEVRRGVAMRRVARRYGTSLSVVQYWVERAAGQRLDRVRWDLPRGCRAPANRTPGEVEDCVLRVRKYLREESALGECGPQAIRCEMVARRGENVPAVRTIARILGRRGVLDGRARLRRPPPPRGWFLPEVCAGRTELDSFDIIEDLALRGGLQVNVLTGISLHGGLCAAWPRSQITAKFTVQALAALWGEFGLPGFAKFDNDTVFQGAHQFADAFGRVTRMCLSLGVTPVFTPPRETGFQADIESFNGRWQAGVWRRFTFANLKQAQRQSRQYVSACRRKCAARIQDAPPRRAFPTDWRLDLQAPLHGRVIFLRRTNAEGRASLLGHTLLAAADWCHRLVRAEVDLTAHEIRFHALRRRDPHRHRHLTTHPYEPPRKRFQE